MLLGAGSTSTVSILSQLLILYLKIVRFLLKMIRPVGFILI
ncbi:unnamed protein product [Protopolystoma xenopodis]|uniref:Uncharacterized protein n=1 Tax=Protopolystoma xenopodis TaxID=117903 RepID=A0A3S5FGV5_9PLAT|nr:unnamed protein product [Protopolystoma xenopodis]